MKIIIDENRALWITLDHTRMLHSHRFVPAESSTGNNEVMYRRVDKYITKTVCNIFLYDPTVDYDNHPLNFYSEIVQSPDDAPNQPMANVLAVYKALLKAAEIVGVTDAHLFIAKFNAACGRRMKVYAKCNTITDILQVVK